MPTYTFRNNESGEEFDRVLRMKDLDSFQKDNPHLSQVITNQAPIIRGRSPKPDSGFRDVLKTIKKGNPRSNVNTFD